LRELSQRVVGHRWFVTPPASIAGRARQLCRAVQVSWAEIAVRFEFRCVAYGYRAFEGVALWDA
jgi:hypothetical protein